ncbi:arabinosyltransferase domain-containing protein [Actinomycetospora cinnamomea]|uniref:EmbC-like arabinotransferase in arabinogalactan biosynthesis n=1 Tax=Actinomycetospora cinnamomea TaxID=663609 RepID=A0A2U1FBE2_9PSEU|nr:arabinosyltransferase domain-containing protein [Actinomycetospora cinnamomea]PVZ09513.1 EmbC-like arabinotransferase in arabinogalactan biosynthesis [Actinomycetospora cinnamomea]
MSTSAEQARDAERRGAGPTRTDAERGAAGPSAGGPGLLLASAALTLLCAIAFPLAPVAQPVVTFTWPEAPGQTAVALPLMPYQPVALDASVSCAALAATPPGAATLATTPPGTPPSPVGGLAVRPLPGGALVTSNGEALAAVPVPRGPCTLRVASDPERTQVAVDGGVVATREGDVRPVVAAVLTGAPSTEGLSLALRTDTRFQTTPGVLKVLLGLGVLVGLAGMVGAAVRGASWRAPRWPRPRPVDGVVALGLVGWALVGPATVDDGYIAGILRSRGENGFTGNVYRWLNAPEAPFSWFYEVMRAWAALAPGEASVLWLRVPATVIGLLLWALLRRHALPRLGPALRRPGPTWVAAAAFAAWWAPFGLSLRPEPWLALGVLAVWVCAERAVATRALLPLLAAAVLAGITVALTPGALLGLAPLLVALPALARAGLGRREGWTRALVVVAGLAVAVLPMAADQSLAGLLEATRVRQLIGGGQPWWQELARYVELVTPGSVQGGLAARLPVLLTLLALPAVAWALLAARLRVGVAVGPARRLLAVAALGPVLLIVSPTKWTLHFGELIGVGTVVLTLFVVLWSPRVVAAVARLRGPALVVVLGGLGLVTTLVLLGHNQWAYASTWGVFWNDIPPQVARVPLADVTLPVTIAGTVVLALVVGARGRLPRRAARVLAPGGLALVLVVAVVALVGGSFVKVTLDRAGTYSYGADALAALRGDPCGLAPHLAVETDPRAGLLPPGPRSAEPIDVSGGPSQTPSVRGATPLTTSFVRTEQAPAAVPLRVGGRELPGWVAPPTPAGAAPAELRSDWFVLPPRALEREAPVVVTASGGLARGSVTLEFAASPTDDPVAAEPGGPTDGTAPRDLRAVAPEGTTLVRVRATSTARDPGTAQGASPAGQAPELPLAVSEPRVPRTVPFDEVVPPGSTALVDWPVAFVFPCLRLPALTGGTAEVPPWRVTPPGLSDAGEIAVAPTTGGPFLTARLLVEEVRLPVYLDGEPTRDAVGLARWVPRLPLGSLTPQVGEETVPGWARTGRASVPVLDTP